MSLGRLGLIQAGQPSKQCPTLAEMTADATATAAYIMAGKTAYVRGEKLTGTLVPVTKIDVAAEGIKFSYSTFEEVPEIFDFSNVTDASHLFFHSNIKSAPNIPEDNITLASSIFSYCNNIETIELYLPECTDIVEFAFGSNSLKSASISCPKVSSLYRIFSECKILTDIKLFSFPNATTAYYALQGAISLTVFPKSDIPNIKNTGMMFYGCVSLQNIEFFDFSNVTNTVNMFQGCSALSSIGDVIFLHTALSLADSPNIDEATLKLLGGFAYAPGESGVAPLKTLGLPAATLTFNTAAQTFLESEGIIAKLTEENWTVNFADSM